MTLSLTIARSGESDVQVKCYGDGNLLKEFYSFAYTYLDVDIDSYIRNDLTMKGFTID